MRGFSLQALAEKLQVSKQMISKYENAVSMPDSQGIIKLGKALDLKPNYFFRQVGVSLHAVSFGKKRSFQKPKQKASKNASGSIWKNISR